MPHISAKLLVVIVVTLAIGVGGAGVWYLQGSSDPGSTFKTVPVERGNIQATISATGTLEPEEVVDVGARVAGQIKKFGRDPRDPKKSIDYGSEVEEDTVLAHLDESIYLAQVRQAAANVQRAEADVLQAKARLQQAEREWTRVRKLRTSGGASEIDYDTALANFESARSLLAIADASVAQAKAAKDEADTNFGYTVIRSPVKGVIVDRRVNVGQTVVASFNAPSLFLIAKDLKRMQVWAAVNEADIGSITRGQRVRFTVDAFPNESFLGEVDQIRLNASMTQNVVTYTVVVNTDNSSGKLLPYLTANLKFEAGQHENVLLVPSTALRWKPQPPQVAPEHRAEYQASLRRANSPGGRPTDRQSQGIVWATDGTFVRPIKVRVGLSDGMYTEVASEDLEEGQSLVIKAVSLKSEDSASPLAPQSPFGRPNKK